MGLSSTADPAVCWRAGFAVPGTQEGVRLKGPHQNQVPMCLPTIRLSFPKCPAVGGQSQMPSLTQYCATFKPGPGPGTSKPLPKAPQQSRTVLWKGLSGPCVERGLIHPLCLDSVGDALGHLFCPFLSEWSSDHHLHPFCVGIVFSVCS